LYVVKPSCLPGSNIKSRIADAAITRTDVHVIVISPSRPGIGAPNNESAQRQLATPAMQVVESGKGMYGAVRDDESFENSDSDREPIAGEVSEATSASFFGLKRVNTQLVEWSWIRGLPKDKAKTVEIVVFADESQEQHSHLDGAVEDDDDLVVAPLNGERPSANSTLPTSRPGSERTSSSVSYTSTDDSEAGQNQKDSLMAQGQEDTKGTWWTDWSKQWDEKATYSTEMLQPG